MPFKAHFYVTIMPTVNDNYVFTYFIYFTWAIKMQNYSYFYFNFSAGIDNFLNIINDPSIHLIIHLVICQKKKEKKKLLRQSNTSNLWTLVISEIIVSKKIFSVKKKTRQISNFHEIYSLLKSRYGRREKSRGLIRKLSFV